MPPFKNLRGLEVFIYSNSVAYFVFCAVMLIASMVAMGYLFMNL
jgi:hypothetical protein